MRTEDDEIFWALQFAEHMLILVRHLQLETGRPPAAGDRTVSMAGDPGRGGMRGPPGGAIEDDALDALVDDTRAVNQEFVQRFRSMGAQARCSADVALHTLEELEYFAQLAYMDADAEALFWMNERREVIDYVLCNVAG